MLEDSRSRKSHKTYSLFVLGAVLTAIAVALLLSGCGQASPVITVPAGVTTTVALGNAGAVPLEAMPYTVFISGGKLNTTSLTVPVGSPVVFKNAEDDNTTQHQFVADGGSFDSTVLDPGGEYIFVFETGGTFAFHDALHPDIKGSIIVNASAAAPDTGIVIAPGPLVRIKGGKLSVTNLQVKIGFGITFANTEDDVSVNHELVADDGSFDTGVLHPNMTFHVLFTKAGTYTYHDLLHPDIKGTITVM